MAMAEEPGAFDMLSAAARGELSELASDCVHCGFCLPSCPTYVLWGQEMDSPRGRIHLMNQGLAGESLSPAMVRHFDACLGCMACVTACPSGVQYNRLIETTRATVERARPRSPAQRALRALVFQLFPYRRRLAALRGPLWIYQRAGAPLRNAVAKLSPTLAAAETLAPPLRRRERLPRLLAARGQRRATVGLLTGCVQSGFFSHVSAATARVLAMEGCEVVVPRGQGCCGALSLHAGRTKQAHRFARRTIDTFTAARVDFVVTDSAGCGSAMKEYADTLADDSRYAARARDLAAKTRDVTELLTELGPVATRHPLPLRMAYHDACHLRHAQRVTAPPRALLRGIPELSVRELAEPEICCGSAGVYNLFEPAAAHDLGVRKAGHVRDAAVDLLAAGNPGCLLQITSKLAEAGTPIPTAHTIEVLDASLRAQSPSTLTGLTRQDVRR